MNRPICQEVRLKDFEPCRNPARYIVDAPAYKDGHFYICGVHARQFRSEALHPLRLRDIGGE